MFAVRGEPVVVVADGAGGTSGGAEAAELLVDHVRRAVEDGAKVPWRQLLLEASLALEGVGQTTAVVVGPRFGASVGDSEAWLVGSDRIVELTAGQPRKPLLGGGFAEPATFSAKLELGETLLLATDGLFKYVKREQIIELVRKPVLSAEALIEAARLPGGGLHDDVAVVLLRRTHASWSKRLREALTLGRSESELRELELVLERWLTRVLPSNHHYGSDGVVVSVVEAGFIAGAMWRLDTQTLYPFELTLRPDEIELRYGDAAAPEGLPGSGKRVAARLPREWLLHVRVEG